MVYSGLSGGILNRIRSCKCYAWNNPKWPPGGTVALLKKTILADLFPPFSLQELSVLPFGLAGVQESWKLAR